MTSTPHYASRIGDDISTYRTHHRLEHYASFCSVEEFSVLIDMARTAGHTTYVLGKGSNTFLASSNIKTAVLKNDLPRKIQIVSDSRYAMSVTISSSVSLLHALRFCEKQSLESFYFLASVPGNVGGALAMNAGGGRDTALSIYNYVDNVTWWEAGVFKTATVDSISRTHRTTQFSGLHSKLIVSATFTFPKSRALDNPIKRRLEYYRSNQDTSGPSCGSVFKLWDYRAMAVLKRTGFRFGGSKYSGRIHNWIVCYDGSHSGIRTLVFVARALHFILGKRSDLEIVTVE